jgi:hypothetical protein
MPHAPADMFSSHNYLVVTDVKFPVSVNCQVLHLLNWFDWFNSFDWFCRSIYSTNSTNLTNRTNLTVEIIQFNQ